MAETLTQHHADEEFPDSSSGCGCFFNLFRREKRRSLSETTKDWWSKQTKKAKELSEVMAGPRWKNFIRRVGGYCRGNRRRHSTTRFQYDPQSYALNFDREGDDDEEEEEVLLVQR